MHQLPALPCYLNGTFTTLPEAKISVMDRGFIFGDGVYEVVPVYAGQPFCFEQHMARLARSLQETRIAPTPSAPEWRDIITQLVAAFNHQCASQAQSGSAAEQVPQNLLVYIQITRGVAMREHTMLSGLTPTVFALCNSMTPPTATQRSHGVACVSADDFRWQKAHIKSTSLLGAVFARQISADAGAVETILFRDGFLSEASASNVWIVKDGTVLGPPKDNLVLEGIRYSLIEELCRTQGIPFALRRISQAEVLAADEVWLSSAVKEVLPVTLLDGHTIGTGQPGALYAAIYAAYQEAKPYAKISHV